MKNSNLSRRQFLRNSTVGAAGLVIGSKIPLNAFETSSVIQNISKSLVVRVSSSNVLDEEGAVNESILYNMLSSSIKTFTGKDDESSAWNVFFSPEDIIGLKVNNLGYSNFEGTPLARHYPVLTNTIIKSMSKAAIPENNFIVWDRSNEELKSAGYTINKDKKFYRVFGCEENRRDKRDEGFDKKEYAVGNKTTRICKILTDECSSLINIPVIKHHRLSGFSGSLKNHYGSIHNARDFHDNNCTNPGIPEINAIPLIRQKQKLIICNGLLGLIDSGPRWNRQYTWFEKSIIIGTDPVAVDAVLRNILEKKRKAEGLDSILEQAKHIELSEKAGLGNANMDNINFVDIEV